MTEQILRKNLLRIIEAEAPRMADGTPSIRAWAVARDLNPRTIYRILHAQHTPSLEMVDTIAAQCKLEWTWQLLTPDFDPNDRPTVWLRASEQEIYLRIINARSFGGFSLPAQKQELSDESHSVPQRRKRK